MFCPSDKQCISRRCKMRFLTSVNTDSPHFGQVNILVYLHALSCEISSSTLVFQEWQAVDVLKEGEDRAEWCWVWQVTHPVQFEKLVHRTCQAIIQRNGYFVILSNNDILLDCTLQITDAFQLWLLSCGWCCRIITKRCNTRSALKDRKEKDMLVNWSATL